MTYPDSPLVAARRKPHTVYDLLDADGVLLYVGCSTVPAQRVEQHRKNQPWGGRISAVAEVVTAPFEEARAVEAMRIHRLRPLFNKIANPSAEWDRGGWSRTPATARRTHSRKTA